MENAETEWIKVSDLGAGLEPSVVATSTILKLLRRAGLTAREKGKDVPTEAAAGLYLERPLGPGEWSSRYHDYGEDAADGDEKAIAGTIQRIWAFEVIAVLKALPPDPQANKKRKPPKMTGKQAQFLRTLCEQTGEPFDPTLRKPEASARIDELRGRLHQVCSENPDLWYSGTEPMTERQEKLLRALCSRAGSDQDGVFWEERLTKAGAAKKISELQRKLSDEVEARSAVEERIALASGFELLAQPLVRSS